MTFMSSSHKKCIILVGTTGTGKSTMAQNLGCTNVKTSSSHRSCTKTNKLYRVSSTLSVLDTVGCEDSSGKSTSSILGDLVQYLGPKNLNNIQVIWTINPNSKSTPEVKKQARWINKLHRNIWKSTCIISKMGTSNNAFKGALGSVVAFSDDNPLTRRLTLLNKLPNDDDIKEAAQEKSKHQRLKKGWLYDNEVKQWTLNLLDNLSTCRLRFTKTHLGSKKYKKYHWGSYSYKGKQVAGAIFGNIFTLGLINLGSGTREDMYYYYWDCCNSVKKYGSECRTRFDEWSCCGRSEHSTGCGWKVSGC